MRLFGSFPCICFPSMDLTPDKHWQTFDEFNHQIHVLAALGFVCVLPAPGPFEMRVTGRDRCRQLPKFSSLVCIHTRWTSFVDMIQ